MKERHKNELLCFKTLKLNLFENLDFFDLQRMWWPLQNMQFYSDKLFQMTLWEYVIILHDDVVL